MVLLCFFAVENSSFEVYGLSFIEQFLEFHAVMIRVNITSFRLIFTIYCYIWLSALFNSKMIIYTCGMKTAICKVAEFEATGCKLVS